MAKTIIETYRGCEIYRLTPPDSEGTTYGSPCVRLLYKKISAVRKRICLGDHWNWIDGTCVSPGPPPPPTYEEPHVAETYRDIEIWYDPATDLYTATITSEDTASMTSRAAVREWIDETLEYLYPPEEPSGGIFAQVVAEIKAWFSPIWTPLKTAWDTFITETLPVITGALTTLGDRWDVFRTETLPSIWDTITARVSELNAAMDQARVDRDAAIREKAVDLRDVIDEKAAALHDVIDERIGDLTSYIDDKVADVDTVGFFEDPLGYIASVFGTLIDAWVHGVIGDLAAGIQAGATMEEPGIHGAGESFMRGFNEVVNEAEE